MAKKTLPKRLENIVERCDKNPIISTKDVPFACSKVLNPAAVKYKNKYYLLLRVQDLQAISHFALATSDNGVDFKISENSENYYVFSPSTKYVAEDRGVEDPRITRINKKNYVTYTAYSKYGTSVGLAETTNFKRFKRLGIILSPDDKDAVLLPEKIKGKYVLYHRPTHSKSVWICNSPDLIHWGEHKPVLSPNIRSWDSEKVGAGAVPFKTEKGWLHIYHGVRGGIYRLGVALFDLEDPSKLIRRSKNYILAPEKNYETIGEIPNVVFTCGAILENDGEIKIYYGAADTSICLGTTKLENLLEMAEKY